MSGFEIKRTCERYGIGCVQARKALEVADARFGGNIRLGVLWTEADAFAINVKGGREARDRWNDEWAHAARRRGAMA